MEVCVLKMMRWAPRNFASEKEHEEPLPTRVKSIMGLEARIGRRGLFERIRKLKRDGGKDLRRVQKWRHCKRIVEALSDACSELKNGSSQDKESTLEALR